MEGVLTLQQRACTRAFEPDRQAAGSSVLRR